MLKNAKRLEAFARIEILAMAAAVVLLFSLAVALSQQANRQRDQSVCQQNLKQISLALLEYSRDYDGLFPKDSSRKSLMWYLPVEPPGGTRPYSCPAQSDPKDSNPKSNAYIYNLAVVKKLNSKATSALKAKPPWGVPNAARIWINTDTPDQGALPGHPGPHVEMVRSATGTDCSFTTWHSGGANFSYLDGHVKWASPQQACELQGSLK